MALITSLFLRIVVRRVLSAMHVLTLLSLTHLYFMHRRSYIYYCLLSS